MKIDFSTKTFRTAIFLLVILVIQFIFPLGVLAEDEIDPAGGGGGGFPIKITNPLRVGTIEELLELVLNLVIQIGIPIIVLTIMWSGFLFIKAQGNPAEVTKAKATIWNVLIGTAIVLGVFSILTIIQATIRALGA